MRSRGCSLTICWRNQREDGALYFSYYPFQNTLYQGIDMARLAHGAWTLARAGRRDAAASALKHIQGQPDDEALGLARDAFILLAQSEPGMAEVSDRSQLAEKTMGLDRSARPYNDVGPSSGTGVLTCFRWWKRCPHLLPRTTCKTTSPAKSCSPLAPPFGPGATPPDDRKIERAFGYYRHRFRYKRDFGQVSWMSLAAAAWWRLTQRRELADLSIRNRGLDSDLPADSSQSSNIRRVSDGSST